MGTGLPSRSDPAAHPHVLAFLGAAHAQVGAIAELLRAVREERPEHRRLGGAGHGLVVERNDHHRKTEHVGEQDELLALVVALLADRGQELDAFEPFLLGQLHLARERVQVLHRGGHDLPQAGVLGLLQPRDDGVGQGVFVELAHGTSSILKCIIKSKP